MDMIFNGQAHGDVASTLMASNFDAGALRPYVGDDGRSYLTLNNGGQERTIVTNAVATLRKNEWIHFDNAVIKAAKPRLNVVADLRGAGLQVTIPNGMGKATFEHEAQSDIGPAIISMDGLREGETERPQYDLRSMPLPIIHKDFSFSLRQVMASRNGGSPLDTTMAALAARRVAEEAEKLALGVSSSYSYGGGTVYGMANFPYRLTKSLTAPTTSNSAVVVNEILAMIAQSEANNYYGPFMLYYSPAYTQYMNGDYDIVNRNGATLLERIRKIDSIKMVKRADYLTGTSLLLVQQTEDVARMVVGMDITTLQWESKGGMQLNFKVMAILVPQIRSDYSNQTGIVHGSV